MSIPRDLHRWFLAALVVAAPAACGPAPEPVGPKALATQPAPGAEKAVAGPTPEQPAAALAAAPEPRDVVATIRWKSPSALFATSAKCAGMPTQIFDAGLKVGIEQLLDEALRGVADVRQLGALVALDAPIDAIVALDPQRKRQPTPLAAVSVGLTSLDGAKRAVMAMGPMRELAPGVWKIGERRNPSCAIAQSTGQTARLVCGERDHDVTSLAPYLARTMAATPPSASDLSGEVRWAAIDARFGGDFRQQVSALPLLAKGEATGEKRLDEAMLEAADALQEEAVALMDDLDKLSLDVKLTPSGCETVGQLSLALRSKKSWIAGLIGDRVHRSGPPPALFWRAPKDADSVFWSRGADPAHYARIVRVLRGLLEGGLAKAKIGTPADRKALADLIQLPLGKDTNTVQAAGRFDPPPRAKAGAKAPSGQQQFDSFMSDFLGWTLFGVDEGPEALSKFVKDAVAVYNRASLLGPLKKEMHEDAKLLPMVKIVPAPKELGKGALAVEIKIANLPDPSQEGSVGRKAAPQRTVTLTMHVLLMPDGKNTWLAVGTNRDGLVGRLMTVKTGAPDANTIASRDGLEKLKTANAMSGGYFTLQPLLKMFSAGTEWMNLFDPGHQPPAELAELQRTLNGLPNKGTTPIVVTSQVAVSSGVKSDVTVVVPKGAVEDIARAATAAASLAKRARP